MHRLEVITSALSRRGDNVHACHGVSTSSSSSSSSSSPSPDPAFSSVDVIVVGGAVCDVAAKSDAVESATLHTSMTGVSWEKDGGVGRNIAEGCSRLGMRCRFITAVGADGRGDALSSRLKESGVDISAIHKSRNGSTATYQCILDVNGGLIAAIADMRVFDQITPGLMHSSAKILRNLSGILCMDTNISAESLVVACGLVANDVIVVIEPTSVPKCTRCLPCLRRVDIVTPNDMELYEMCRALGGSAGSVAEAARYLLEHSGLLAVVVTMGKEGVALYLTGRPVGKEAMWSRIAYGSSAGPAPTGVVTEINIPAAVLKQEEILDVTGAGDSLVAGTLAGLQKGLSLQRSIAELGTKAARSTLKSARSVSATLFQDCFEK